jgi:hypothetical protein
MAPEPISTVYFIIAPSQSVCVLCVTVLLLLDKHSVKCIPPFIARQRLANMFPQQLLHETIEYLLAACVEVRFHCGQCRIKGAQTIRSS